MTKKNPFDSLLDQITDMLSLVKDKKSQPIKGKLDEGIDEQLDALEKQMELFKKITDQAINSSGLNKENLERTIKEPEENLSVKDSRLLKRAKGIKEEMETLQKEFTRKKSLAKLKKKKAKTSGKKRKKKFKRVGGQGWMPL